MRKILTTVCILWGTVLLAQPIGYLGKTTYLDVCMNLSINRITTDGNLNMFRQFDIAANKVISKNKQLVFSGSYYWNEKYRDYSENRQETGNILMLEFGYRKYKNKKHKSIAPIGRFFEIDIDYLITKNTLIKYNGDIMLSKIESNVNLLQPGIKFGRQAIFYNKIICSAGCKFSAWPFIIKQKNNFTNNISFNYFFRNMISAFYSVGIIL